MQIIFTREVADTLREKYTLLQLDTRHVPEHGPIETFCVLEPENIVMEMSSLDENVQRHNDLVAAMQKDDCETAQKLCNSLIGCFGGELDSFYEVVLERINTTHSTILNESDNIV